MIFVPSPLWLVAWLLFACLFATVAEPSRTSLRERFFAFDDTLASLGVPPLTSWWREGIGRWLDAYENGHVLELWACVGRGAAKSTALYKLALFFLLFGDFVVPIGERHFAIILSRLVSEASKGIEIMAGWLTKLGVPHRTVGDVIELADLPRGIRVVAASVAAASGWRAFFVGRDERSKWPASGIEEVDAVEIDTSAVAMTATHPHAPVVSFGSAWGDFGSFYDAIIGGSDASKVVLGPVPSWIAAPHLRIEDLRRKEKDAKRFAREYESVFQIGATSALDLEQLYATLHLARPGSRPLSAPLIGFDSSMGLGDDAAWAVTQWWQAEADPDDCWETVATPEGTLIVTHANGTWKRRNEVVARPKPELVVYGVGALTGKFAARGITSDDMVAAVAKLARDVGAHHIVSDQYQGFALTSAFAKHGLAYTPQVWSAETKAEALLRLRTWLRDRTLVIEPTPEGQELVKELINLQEIIRPSGSIGLAARRGHDDRACALLSVAMADSVGFMPGSPIRKANGMQVQRNGVWVDV